MSQKIQNPWIKTQSSLENTSFRLRKEHTKATSYSLTPRGYKLSINKEVCGVNADREFLLMLGVFENLRSEEQCK